MFKGLCLDCTFISLGVLLFLGLGWSIIALFVDGAG